MMMRPDDAEALLAPMFEVSGLPLWCGREAMGNLIPGWVVSPLYTYKQQSSRTWIVAAKEAPFERTYQHADGLVLIQEHQPTRRFSAGKAPTFVPASRPGSVEWPQLLSGKQTVGSQQHTESAARSAAEAGAAVAASPTLAAAPPLQTQDLASIVQAAVSSAMSGFDTRLTALASELAEMQSTKQVSKDQRSKSRAESRGRCRVPIGKRLGR